jgi:iron complex outermembrane recepter protein
MRPAGVQPRSSHSSRGRRDGISSLGAATSASAAVLLAAASLTALPANAQRAEENAIVAANDAFGTSVGRQTIGLYSPTNARGFNPIQAGNVRIEGLYFDQQVQTTNSSLFSGSDMRIGVAAQSYSFPSPTGIADYKLRTPGDVPTVSAIATRGPFEGKTLQVDSQYPLIAERLSASLSVAGYQDFDYNAAQRSQQHSAALVLRFRPAEHVEIVPFIGYQAGGEHRELPFVYADAVHRLPLFQERQLPTQEWSSWGWGQTTAGVIAKDALSRTWTLTVGLFRSKEDDRQNFNDLLIGPLPNRTADHVMDIVPPSTAGSYSGDLRLARLVTDGVHQHELQFSARRRQVKRDYGGDFLIDFGSISIDHTPPAAEPPVVFSAKSRDDTRQTGIGVDYFERWKGVGALGLGVLRTDYSRSVTSPGSVSARQRTSTLLPTASFTADAGHGLAFYGSYTRGLEDSVIAPASAINRGEPPPATPTWQIDAGIKYQPGRNLEALLGVFDVHKLYFNLDPNNVYRQLGDVSNRGLEASATLSGVEGLKVVAGLVIIRPAVRRQTAGMNAAGTVPVGPVPQTVNLNIDYAPTSWRGWGASLQWTRLSSRVETDDDRYELPPLSTLNIGARYTRKLFDHPISVRFDIANLTNASGLTISPLYLVLPQDRRNFILTVAIDS